MSPVTNFSEMKDSGIPWVGLIPSHWNDVNPKALFMQRKDRANIGDRQLTASQQYGVIYQDEYMELTGAKVVTVEKDFSILKRVEAGDFVISMRSFQGGLEYSTKSGSISSAYVMLIPNLDLVYPRFYRWLLKSNGYIDALQSTSDLIRDGQAMRYSNFAQVRLITLPLKEQEEIANYLDAHCARIDQIIAEAKASIEEYKAWKASIIYEAVTKGLAPNVEMKDSGVEWIGEMPTTWRTMRIKDLGDARNGLTYSPEDQVDEGQGTLVLRSSNVQGGKLAFSDNVYVGSEIPPELILQQGDILICSRNGSRKLIGKNAYIEEDNKYSFGAFMMALRPKIANKKYVYWLLNSGVFGYYLPMFFTSTINQLTRENFRNMVVPYCDDELVQQRIVEYLDAKVSKIDGIIEGKETLVADLEAYKKALIFEVVTGKRKVV